MSCSNTVSISPFYIDDAYADSGNILAVDFFQCKSCHVPIPQYQPHIRTMPHITESHVLCVTCECAMSHMRWVTCDTKHMTECFVSHVNETSHMSHALCDTCECVTYETTHVTYEEVSLVTYEQVSHVTYECVTSRTTPHTTESCHIARVVKWPQLRGWRAACAWLRWACHAHRWAVRRRAAPHPSRYSAPHTALPLPAAPETRWVGHDAFICGTWRIHMWDMMHSCGTRRIHMWDKTHSYVGHDVFTCGTWCIHTWDMTHSYVQQDSCRTAPVSLLNAAHRTFTFRSACGTWGIHACDVTHLYVWRDSWICATRCTHRCDSSICVTWRIHMRGMAHLYVWHD